jgi:Cellulose-binding Sde182, nucleoside hydrolase-like domain
MLGFAINKIRRQTLKCTNDYTPFLGNSLTCAWLRSLCQNFFASADEPISTTESQASHIDTFQGKPRIFVLTDIGNEPDDQMSLTRFLLYSNELDVEGLVAVTSTWQREKVAQRSYISHYRKIRSKLLKHADGFPYLRGLVSCGETWSDRIRHGRRRQRSAVTWCTIVYIISRAQRP